ncbi:MAG: CTP synthase [Clostridiales bacterium]|nr:CTP synthase [Clostridiales bacterium]
MATKFVFVTGGVVSSLGKGITAASLGRLLKARGYNISMQKLDPYYNVDPGLLSPLQHGEAFITDDGIAADLDLGHYERFVDITLPEESSITTGKIHKKIMERELRGEYRGGTVQVIPHVTNEIKYSIRKAAEKSNADIAIIEIGGTVGDMESSPYLEAIRQMRWEVGEEDCCYIHVTLLPYIAAAGEMKTKPTQHSVKELRSIGIDPDIIVCRTEKSITQEIKNKIALFCNVKTGNVVQNLDVPLLYEVPLMMEKEGLAQIVCRELGLECDLVDLSSWEEMIGKIKNATETVNIALVGKYIELHDAYLSVVEALNHAGIENATSINIVWISSHKINEKNVADILQGVDGIIVPGGYGKRGAEGIIQVATYARKNQVPYFTIGFGMQLTVVEAVRNLLEVPGANSYEVDESTSFPVTYIPKERITSLHTRAASRMGGEEIALIDSLTKTIYADQEVIRERHGNRYEIDKVYLTGLNEKGFVCVGQSVIDGFPEVFELVGHPFHISVIYHPEFLSRPNRAHPLFDRFIRASVAYKKSTRE